MSLALTAPKTQIGQWLALQLNDRPLASGDFRNSLIGRRGTIPTRTVGEVFNSLIDVSTWSYSVETSMKELAIYFHLPEKWYDREGFGTWLLNPLIAIFADSWFYRQWLHQHHPSMANAYAMFFAATVQHPEWIKAMEWGTGHHYPSEGGNLYDVLPKTREFIHPECLKKTPWAHNHKQKSGKELIRRGFEAWNWVADIFTGSEEERASKLEKGLSHLTLGVPGQGDTEFFVALGRGGPRPISRSVVPGNDPSGNDEPHYFACFGYFGYAPLEPAMRTTDPETLSPTDRELLQKVQEVINGKEKPILLGPEGGHVQMPSSLFHVLTQATRALLSGQSVQILSQGEECTTQGAADFLGCSRPFLVKLLNNGEIPFHYVGTHRRVTFQNLQDYRKKRDRERKGALSRLTQLADDDDYAEDCMSGDRD